MSFLYLTEVGYRQELLQFREELRHKELHVRVVAETVFCGKNFLRKELTGQKPNRCRVQLQTKHETL